MNRLFLLFLFATPLASCKYDNADTVQDNYQVQFSFTHKVGSTPFVTHSNYTSPFGEPYVLDVFRYYVSNIEFLRNGLPVNAKERDSYHLVDAGNSATEKFVVKIPATNFDAVTFTIGVDSIRNVSGAQTGALDPLNGMFWTWNSGYIMVKMEGTTPLSTNSGNKFEWHIGGFKLPYNNTRKIMLNFPAGKTINTALNGMGEVAINVDISKWFNAVHNFKIAENPFSIHTVIPVTQKVADNYATLFNVSDVINR